MSRPSIHLTGWQIAGAVLIGALLALLQQLSPAGVLPRLTVRNYRLASASPSTTHKQAASSMAVVNCAIHGDHEHRRQHSPRSDRDVLPTTVLPLLYRLRIEPNRSVFDDAAKATDFTFSGDASIEYFSVLLILV